MLSVYHPASRSNLNEALQSLLARDCTALPPDAFSQGVRSTGWYPLRRIASVSIRFGKCPALPCWSRTPDESAFLRQLCALSESSSHHSADAAYQFFLRGTGLTQNLQLQRRSQATPHS